MRLEKTESSWDPPVPSDAQTTNPNQEIRAVSEVQTEQVGRRRQRFVLGVGGGTLQRSWAFEDIRIFPGKEEPGGNWQKAKVHLEPSNYTGNSIAGKETTLTTFS